MEKPQLTDEEKKVLDEARSIRRKARGNNGAKRDIHEECEVEYKDVYPMTHPSTSSRHIHWRR